MSEIFARGGRRPAAAPLRFGVAILIAALVVMAPAMAPPAWAAGSVSVTDSSGGAVKADPDYATTVTVSGRGFQSIQGGFGGIYVLFGWVKNAASASWTPSNGGVVGADYRYVPDQESSDNAGYERFIAFPGSETEAAASGTIAADGSWSVGLVIPGATFTSTDRTGKTTEVDCLEVQCGVITIGAHGVKNANNESFTPIEFASGSAAAASGAPGAAAPPGEQAAAPTKARVGYASSSAVAGNALSFTGQGFNAGEQVVASLDDGAAAVGPLTAGLSGEVAGVLALPADLRAGTHALTVMGAASGNSAQTEVTVKAAANRFVPTTQSQSAPIWPYLALGICLIVALGLLMTSVITSLVRSGRARAARRAALSAKADDERAVGDATTEHDSAETSKVTT